MLKVIFLIGVCLILFLFLLVLAVYLYYLKRAEKIEKKVNKKKIKNNREYQNFTVKNPYKYEGKYYKAQLHTHTKESDGKIKVPDLIKEYKNKGYNFLAITDHNKITVNKDYDDENFITIPGEELTIINPFWPLGRHLNRLFINHKINKNRLGDVDEILKGEGINVINHPATISGLGTQRWDIDFLINLNNIRFIEIANHFSKEKSNIKYWHILLNKYGNKNPIWALAVDDAHQPEDIDVNWVMVKANKISEKELKKALQRGSFYCTQGPQADFYVHDNIITVKLKRKHEIKFINAENKIVKKVISTNYSYEVQGVEGFLRVEVINKTNNKKLWSQPFWLAKKDEV